MSIKLAIVFLAWCIVGLAFGRDWMLMSTLPLVLGYLAWADVN